MQDPDGEEIPEYVIALVDQALLHDARVGEQGLHSEIHGHRLVISGVVSTAERQQLVGTVAAEVAPTIYDIVNQTELAVHASRREHEELP
jgi:hypothetical protein